VAASSAILLNITLMVAVGTMIVTPDAPLLVVSLLPFALAKVLQTGRGVWWLAVGAAAGCALLSKYTALFFGPAILIWLVAVPKLRHWLISPWLYLGIFVVLCCFLRRSFSERRAPLGFFIKQMGREDRDFHPATSPNDPDADRVRDAAGADARRDGALRAVPPPRRRCPRACSPIRCSGHRRPFRLALPMPASSGLRRSSAFADAAAVAAHLVE
jgi:hypothetical protein